MAVIELRCTKCKKWSKAPLSTYAARILGKPNPPVVKCGHCKAVFTLEDFKAGWVPSHHGKWK